MQCSQYCSVYKLLLQLAGWHKLRRVWCNVHLAGAKSWWWILHQVGLALGATCPLHASGWCGFWCNILDVQSRGGDNYVLSTADVWIYMHEI